MNGRYPCSEKVLRMLMMSLASHPSSSAPPTVVDVRGPAARHGVCVGDMIVAVDGESTSHLNANLLETRLRRATKECNQDAVRLRLVRKGVYSTMQIPIPGSSVEGSGAPGNGTDAHKGLRNLVSHERRRSSSIRLEAETGFVSTSLAKSPPPSAGWESSTPAHVDAPRGQMHASADVGREGDTARECDLQGPGGGSSSSTGQAGAPGGVKCR